MSGGEVGRMLSEEKWSGEDGKMEFEMKGEGRILDAGAYRERERDEVGNGVGRRGSGKWNRSERLTLKRRR